ncbi:hypothetical protein ANANG_G00230150 [Anguilla anguilla]|uniref:Uncharacterized protein n=1 Tax=Anguilla anguilla TaxID=7936 RepID=A0A9D3RMZ4_ANGAN|nr:hypothetical protein ANANG_G00230150 [Anguilla anguilla]
MQLIGRMQNGHCSVLISFHYCKQCWVQFSYWVRKDWGFLSCCFNFLYFQTIIFSD